VDKFLANLWAAQIAIDDSLLQQQKAWETNFWAVVVKKGGEGSKFETGGFNEAYWKTKATDNYPLVDITGNVVIPANNNRYSADEVNEWLTKA